VERASARSSLSGNSGDSVVGRAEVRAGLCTRLGPPARKPLQIQSTPPPTRHFETFGAPILFDSSGLECALCGQRSDQRVTHVLRGPALRLGRRLRRGVNQATVLPGTQSDLLCRRTFRGSIRLIPSVMVRVFTPFAGVLALRPQSSQAGECSASKLANPARGRGRLHRADSRSRDAVPKTDGVVLDAHSEEDQRAATHRWSRVGSLAG
jgi:hypothetical protein